jgi:hypothetical protein
MKKSLIPVLALLIAIVGFGCGKKTEVPGMSVVDSIHASDSVKAIHGPFKKFRIGQPTTIITPPAVGGDQLHIQPVATPDLVTLHIRFKGYDILQTVTVAGLAADPIVYANMAAGAPTTAKVIPEDQAGTFQFSGNDVVITAGFNNPAVNYNNVENDPLDNPNRSGSHMTQYYTGVYRSIINVICITQ